MAKLKFLYFMDYEDGEIARVETSDDGGLEIPFNIFKAIYVITTI